MRRLARPLLASTLAIGFAALAACSDPTTRPSNNPTHPLAATAASTTGGVAVLSNLKVASGKTYKVVPGGMSTGDTLYIDRTYTVQNSVPAAVQGATYIETANDDKKASAGSPSFLSFSVAQYVTVYVAHDSSIALPAWLASTAWQDAGVDLVSTDNNGKHFRLRKRSFSPGTVTLGSNIDSGNGGSMYSVIVVADSSPTSAPPPSTDTTGSSVAVLSNLKVASGKTYKVVTGAMNTGDTLYVDRTYTVQDSVPAAVRGATYIETANDDKTASAGSSTFLSFSVAQSVTVYVAHDNSIALPSWLASTAWQDAGVDLVTTDNNGKHFRLRKRSFAAGTVTLGSNIDSGSGGSMYSVMVVANGSSSTTPSAGDTIPPAVTLTAPLNGATVSGTVAITATASDNIGVAGVRFLVDSKDVAPEDTTSPYAVSWNSTLVANGTHSVTAVARDKAGNTALKVIQVSVQNSTTTSPTPSSTHTGWYVAPNGSSGGSGSAASPWDLATALAGGNGKVQPGDTIWLRGGTYGSGDNSTNFTSTLTGTTSQPIIVRQYPGERATLNATLTVNGAYAWYWDFEVANTETGPQTVHGISVAGPGTKFIDLVVHDHTGDAIFAGESAPDAEIYGCILYNNGFLGQPGAVFSHGIYAQNLTGTKTLRDNVIFQTYGYGLHIYGHGGHLNNFTIDGNVVFNNAMTTGNNFYLGGSNPLVNLRFTNNLIYGTGGTGTIGEGALSSGGIITNNYFVGGQLTMRDWSSVTVQGNTMVQPNAWEIVILNAPTTSTLANYQWSGNQYYRFNTSGMPFTFQDASAGTSQAYSFQGWQGLGLDNGSNYVEQRPPTKVVVEPNQYEPGRANIVVYNYGGQSSATVDLSGVLAVGDHYEVRNVENFYGAPVATGTYGGSLTLPLSTATPPTPVGGWSANAPATGNEFNTFVVRKTN